MSMMSGGCVVNKRAPPIAPARDKVVRRAAVSRFFANKLLKCQLRVPNGRKYGSGGDPL